MTTQHDNAVILEAIARGQRLLDEREEARRLADEQAERSAEEQRLAEWAPVLDEIRRRLPEWARGYVQAGSGDHTYTSSTYDVRIQPALVAPPDGPTVLAYAVQHDGAWSCGFLPVDYITDAEGYARPVAQGRAWLPLDKYEVVGSNGAEDNFLLALAYSAANAARRQEDQEAHRNKQADAKGEDLPDPIDQALQLAGLLSRGEPIKQERTEDFEDYGDARTLVIAAGQIAIAHHLRRCADGIERLTNILNNRP